MKKFTALLLALALVLAMAGCTDKKGVTVTDSGSGTEPKKAITKEEMTASDAEDNSMTVSGRTDPESLPESPLMPESDMVSPAG